jgi:polyphosphate glucokinase
MAATDNLIPPPATILVIDIGGSKVKILATGETSSRKFQSGKRLTPTQMVVAVHERTDGWAYEAISIGYPGVVGARGPRSEPGNLGPGWVGFNFAAAFDRPVRIINDAAMQALGNYDGGRMLFLGLGTGLGSALIADRVIVPLELGRLPYPGGPLLDHVLGQRGLATGQEGLAARSARDCAASYGGVPGGLRRAGRWECQAAHPATAWHPARP